MKTIKLLLLTICLISFSNLNAQDETNDATWSETVNFINKYKSHLSSTIAWSGYGRGEATYKTESISISLNEINITGRRIRYATNKSSYKQIKYKLNLNKLNYGSWSNNRIELRTVGNDIKFSWGYVNDGGSLLGIRDYERNNVYIIVPDSEMHDRLGKAFKHLAYLASKEREKNRKQSGEKF